MAAHRATPGELPSQLGEGEPLQQSGDCNWHEINLGDLTELDFRGPDFILRASRKLLVRIEDRKEQLENPKAFLIWTAR